MSIDMRTTKAVAPHLAKVAERMAACVAEDRPMAALTLLRDTLALTEALRVAVTHEARATGHTWAAIGSCLGMSRQAAQQWYAAATQEPDPAPDAE